MKLRLRRWSLLAALPLAAGAVVPIVSAGAASVRPTTEPSRVAGTTCDLGPGGRIHHVIWIQFDNTHLLRDKKKVPSDIQQMPALLHFMKDNGTILDNDHTPLIAHTANDLVTSLTGVYPDRQGIPEANSYQYYEPNGTTDTAGSFGYWTDPVDSYSTSTGRGVGDHTPNMIDAQGKMAPAPWVPYTRAGCDLGEIAYANMDLENNVPDVPDVFGPHSPQAKLAESNYNLAETDFEGLAIHCAKASRVCAGSNAVSDRLPDEPGGYHGYRAVFGAKELDPFLAADGKPTNLDGEIMTGYKGTIGFPGYNSMEPTNSLAYTLDMQAKGIPVTYTYVTDAHDNNVTGNGMGPGMPSYEAQLKAYNAAFVKFFKRLAAMGINKSNTLFVFGEDENDHYVGSAPQPANCNGITTPCHYKTLGEVGANLQGLLAKEQHVTTAFAVHDDSAPFVYLDGQPRRTSTVVRRFGRALAKLTAWDPYRHRMVKLTNYLADPVELRLLHMITADPKRTPTFAEFANPDFWLSANGTTCSNPYCEGYAPDGVWNHGDVAPDINRTWMAFVGPGVARHRVSHLWASETDTRPTVMHLLGLRDDYQHEGVVLPGILTPAARGGALGTRRYSKLAAAYTSIESPVGPFGLASLEASTKGIASAGGVYGKTETALAKLGTTRDSLGATMIDLLEGVAFHGLPLSASQETRLVHRADALIGKAVRLADST